VLFLYVQQTLGICRNMVPRRPPLRENRACSGCIEVSALKVLRFTYIAHTVCLSIHNVKPHGVGYITVTQITVHINTAR
jgi:hypothetical protein